MKITQAPHANLVVTNQGAKATPAPGPKVAVGEASGTQADFRWTRPVRINRAPEEAALFAYNSQAMATTHTSSRTHIDEYV